MAIDPARAISRSVRIAKLDVATFEEVEADTSATQEAGAVAVVASIIGAIGSIFVNGLWGFIATILILIVGWYIWAWLAAFIAEKVFNVTTTNTGEMLRATGYAYAPRVLGVIPYGGAFIGGIWSLVAVIIGMRQAGEMTTMQAVITAVIGFIPAIIGIGIVTAVIT